jgi:phage terminase large subunit-like protein
VFFPKNAPWLDELKAELLGFPNTKNDDQVDSITQALLWIKKRRQHKVSIAMPIVVCSPLQCFGDMPPDYR